MPLVFTDATLFTQKKPIPALPGDIIAIELPLYNGRLLRSLSQAECEKHFQVFHPELFIILSRTKKPRYSSFRCEINSKTPIELSPTTQSKLLNFVNNFDDEVSGRISFSGDIDNIKFGTPNWSPLQPKRTVKHISFHTHPRKTYDKFNTNYGWPSIGDMREIEQPPSNTTNSHIIPSVEGIYLISSKTCDPPEKGKLSRAEFDRTLNKCSWILLPWKLDNSWFVY